MIYIEECTSREFTANINGEPPPKWINVFMDLWLWIYSCGYVMAVMVEIDGSEVKIITGKRNKIHKCLIESLQFVQVDANTYQSKTGIRYQIYWKFKGFVQAIYDIKNR